MMSRVSMVMQLSLVSVRGVSSLLQSLGRQRQRQRQLAPPTRLFSSNRLLDTSKLQNTFCALRHGRSLANEAAIISSHPDVATIQHGLSRSGEEQAKQAGIDVVVQYDLLAQDSTFDGICILTSDYLRAMETALHVAKAVAGAGLPLHDGGVIFERRLRERWFGEWDGGSDVHYPAVWKDDAIDSSHTLRGVESVDSVMDRTTECVLEWDARLSNQLVLLVAHGDVLQIAQTAFAKMDGTKHRSVEHLETATLRPIELASWTGFLDSLSGMLFSLKFMGAFPKLVVVQSRSQHGAVSIHTKCWSVAVHHMAATGF